MMRLDQLSKIRGDILDFYGQCYSALKVSPTPTEVVREETRMGFRLLRAVSLDKPPVSRTKLLLVPHIINRPYILDLKEDVSVVRFLCRQGFDVYMIDWGYPTLSHRHISFDHYARYVDLAIDSMETAMPVILGYCTGGIIALIRASRHPKKLKALVLLATPVDFTDWRDPRLLWGKFFNHRLVADFFGNIPGELIDFIGLQLFTLFLPRFAMDPEFWTEFLDHDGLDNQWRRWRWVLDSQAIPSSVYQQFIEDCYQKNLLIQNRMRVANRRVDLNRIRAPLLNILARFDHIVPPASVRALSKVYGGDDYQEILFSSSHVGLSTSRKAQQHLWPQVARWLRARAKIKT